jgi:beta-galactosidase/beta-glucuronidase
MYKSVHSKRIGIKPAMIENQLAKTFSLDGVWDFALGSPPQWGQIQVPGCWEAQGYSKLVDGPAFYRRRVLIPAGWADEHIFIEFDAVSYAGVVRCNGVQVGDFRGLWTPFACEVTSAVRPGEEALIELEVYKPGQRYPMRSSLAGFLPDVATSFGGIWQPVRLLALTYGLEDVLVEPDPVSGQVRVRCHTPKAGAWALVGGLGAGDWQVSIYAGELQLASECLPLEKGGALDMKLAVPQPVWWSPDCPAMYELRLRLIQSDQPVAQVSRRFGFRRLAVQGGLLRFNEQPVLLRGVLSWGWQPDHIAPPTPRSGCALKSAG